MKNDKLETRRKRIPKSVSIYVQTEFNKIDAKHIFIGEYLERNKKAFKGLEYGLEYLNKVADMEAKAERKWDKINGNK